MNTETKIVAGIVIATILVIAGGVIFLSVGGNSGEQNQSNVTINKDILIRPTSPVMAGKDSEVTIVEFADFECPYCQQLHASMQELLAEEGDKITLVYRNFPIHPHSIPAAVAALAAGNQGKYWQMYDQLFNNQDAWSGAATDADRAALYDQYAATIGLNVEQFDKDSQDPKYTAIVTQDQQDGESMGIDSTPTLIIDSKIVSVGGLTFADLKKLVDNEIAANEAGTSTTAVATTSATSTQ